MNIFVKVTLILLVIVVLSFWMGFGFPPNPSFTQTFWAELFFVSIGTLLTVTFVDFLLAHDEERKWHNVKGYANKKFESFRGFLEDRLSGELAPGADKSLGSILPKINDLFLKERLSNLDKNGWKNLENIIVNAQSNFRDIITQYAKWMDPEAYLKTYEIDDSLNGLGSIIHTYVALVFPETGTALPKGSELETKFFGLVIDRFQELVTHIVVYSKLLGTKS